MTLDSLSLITGLLIALICFIPVLIVLMRQGSALRKREGELLSELGEAKAEAARREAENAAMAEKLELQKGEIEKLHERLNGEFELMAGKILAEKSDRLSKDNMERLSQILNPLKERISSFEKKVDEAYSSETREKAGLRKELEQMMKMNLQMSEDARRLTRALKGDSKTQGDWGELQLEMILQKAGLEEGVHYVKQQVLHNEEGAVLRPDFVINLPENKNFVIDCKVSLTAYERYCSAEDDAERERALDEHVRSLRRHIQGLGQKNYQNLYGINSPDFVFLYVAVEPAMLLALQADRGIFDYAFSKNIALVAGTTLLATMRTVAFIWRQENQKKNALEIALEGGRLYDKFVGFTEDLLRIGKKLDEADAAYDAAMNKLRDSSKYGDTIMGRIENLKKLGANAQRAQLAERGNI